MLDLEGLEDLPPIVVNAILTGMQTKDSNIHPDQNSLAHPIARTSVVEEPGWIEKLKQKLSQLQSQDGNIYPLF